jgi:hypothetical protein
VEKKSKPKRRTKERTKTDIKKGTMEREYQRTFTPLRSPFHGRYADEDSLEQPSELDDVPATSVPYAEA